MVSSYLVPCLRLTPKWVCICFRSTDEETEAWRGKIISPRQQSKDMTGLELALGCLTPAAAVLPGSARLAADTHTKRQWERSSTSHSAWSWRGHFLWE